MSINFSLVLPCYNEEKTLLETLTALPKNVIGFDEVEVLIIDDVITAGTAIREVMTMVEGADAEAAAVMIGLDRKERGASAKSAIQEVEEQFSIPVISIIDMDDILSYLQSQPDMAKVIEEISTYRNEYGV